MQRLVPLLLLAAAVVVASALLLGRVREEAAEGEAPPHDSNAVGASRHAMVVEAGGRVPFGCLTE